MIVYLTQLCTEPRNGPVIRQVVWPGDDRVWTWNGLEWVAERTEFDGGDLWDSEDDGAVSH